MDCAMKYVARSIAVIRIGLSPGIAAIIGSAVQPQATIRASQAVVASGCRSYAIFLMQPHKKERNPS
jgi:hypothetical protein